MEEKPRAFDKVERGSLDSAKGLDQYGLGSVARPSALDIAGSDKFSSDRTIRQYADEIWGVTPRPVA